MKVDYGLTTRLEGLDLEEGEARVTAALKDQGFGVLTRIDVKETLKKKLDVEFKPYVILGACNPQLAHRALSEEEAIGLLLPCNVIVVESGGGCDVAFLKPHAMFQVVENENLESIADEADQLIRKACQAL